MFMKSTSTIDTLRAWVTATCLAVLGITLTLLLWVIMMTLIFEITDTW
jgi:hypothetical protein